MSIIKNLLVLALILVLNSCATSTKFPISNVVPAATISAKKGTNKQGNFTLEITSKDLASANRLDPPGNNYSIWVVTKDYGEKNVGQLMVKNGKKTTFNAITAFDFSEVFITVENQGNLLYPQGIEIARTKL